VRIYLHHSNKIWSDPVILNWLEITTHKVLPRLQSLRKKEMDHWAKKFLNIFFLNNLFKGENNYLLDYLKI